MNAINGAFTHRHFPNWLWIMTPSVALFPVWQWYVARLSDGSDDPLGIIALAALAVFVVRDRAQFTEPPRLRWLALSLLLTALAVIGRAVLADLFTGVIAILALSSALFAVRGEARPMVPLIGLGLLALPLLSSLQFYAGFPLRALTAEATTWLLRMAGYAIQREGSTLEIEGMLVMVDAPCSGIQMGWMAYFTACAAAAWWRVSDIAFLRRLPLVGAWVLIGNIVRNTILVVKEAGLVQWPQWTHEAVGGAAFALVCGAVLRLIVTAPRAKATEGMPFTAAIMAAAAHESVGAKAATMIAFVTLALWNQVYATTSSGAPTAAAFEWPSQYRGQTLRPLALSSVEQRFADHFPGNIGRFQAGPATLVLRQVNSPTRLLHPAADCFRGLGYRISDIQLRRSENVDTDPSLQRCFVADDNKTALRVCEHIVGADGKIYTDTSSWYWAALTGESAGPWQAITEATPL